MSDPDYIAQTSEEEHTASQDARRAWIAARVAEAKAEGCTWPRHSWDTVLMVPPEGVAPVQREVMLFEGWKVRPEETRPPAWQFAPVKGLREAGQ